MAPSIDRIDHIHVYVSDRPAAEAWYTRVFGFRRIPELEFWAVDDGPLTVTNDSGTVHLALFQRPSHITHSVIALLVSREGFHEWLAHAQSEIDEAIAPVDHDASWSLYFRDPDGNPFEITSYEYDGIAEDLAEQAAS